MRRPILSGLLRVPLLLLLLLLLLLIGAGTRAAVAEEAWEAEARRAETEQTRLVEEAKRRGTTRQLVSRYASRVSRQPTPLNHYLLGRALYYDGDTTGAERQLRIVLQRETRFWFARRGLAILEFERGRVQEAERHLTTILQAKPREPDVLKLLARIRIEAKEWGRALPLLQQLLALDPTNDEIRLNIALVYVETKEWTAARNELRVLRGRSPKDPRIRWYYANTLFELGDLVEAGRELEGLVRIDAQDVRALDLLRLIYAQQEDWPALQRTLERMLPLVRDPKVAEQIRGMVAELERGPPEAGTTPTGADVPEGGPEAAFRELLGRCMNPADVSERRAALQEYYQAGIPLLPGILLQSVDPKREPDPICRSWVLRIVGSLREPKLAYLTALALFDPDIGVRCVAAESLGEIGTASAVLYLMPYFLAPEIDAARHATQEREMNAARSALILLTERLDSFGGADAWVPAVSLGQMREDWGRWFVSPEGVEARLKAMADFVEQDEPRPELYLIEDASDPEPRIARTAYDVLLRRSRKPAEEDGDPVAEAMWPRFPRLAGPDLATEAGLVRMRTAVAAWWVEWQALRASTSNRDR